MLLRDLLARAKSASNLTPPVRYRLGAGGMSPAAATPANNEGFCDCSGYVCWALGLSRHTDHPLYVAFNGGWINTDAMVNDGMALTGLFSPVLGVRANLADAPVGAILVYGRLAGEVGHTGIVDAPGQVIHCSAGNYRRTGNAIAVTPPTLWQSRARAIVLWYAGVVA